MVGSLHAIQNIHDVAVADSQYSAYMMGNMVECRDMAWPWFGVVD